MSHRDATRGSTAPATGAACATGGSQVGAGYAYPEAGSRGRMTGGPRNGDPRSLQPPACSRASPFPSPLLSSLPRVRFSLLSPLSLSLSLSLSSGAVEGQDAGVVGRKGRSKSKGAGAAAAAAGSISFPAGEGEEKVGGGNRKKASSFDEALLAKAGRGKQQAVVGHPLPRPASLPAPLPSPSASASASASASSGGSSSLGSSAASDEPPDLGAYRLSETSSILSVRTVATETRKQNHLVAEGRLFTNNQAPEHPGSPETSVSPRKEFHLQNLDLAKNGSRYCRGRKSTEIVFSTPIPSSPPSSRGHQYPTSPVRSRTFGQCPTSPTSWQDDSRSASSPQPLPLPPSPPSPSLQWKKGKLLGSGTFGQVYLGFNSEGGQMCAIKEVKVISDDSNSKECLRQLNQEIVLLSQLSHPNIVRYYGSDLSNETLSVYLEANILVDPNGDIKLADFGMAKHISAYTSIKSFKGSPYWMAPEVIMNSNGYSLSVDIWSLGCTILEMATAKPPWSQYEGVAAIFKIGNSKDIPDIPDHLSSDAKNFLKLCLQRDPAARPTAAKLMDHPFVKDHATVRSSKSSMTRDLFATSTDGKNSTVQTSVGISSYRSLSPLRDPDVGTRNLLGPTSPMPSTINRRISVMSPLYVSSFSTPHPHGVVEVRSSLRTAVDLRSSTPESLATSA
ncbi:hypothetical protein PR202_ga24525 [Eleusine coracana subsp. coracana]|uniref:mitogen-activated protein kinase kinase kinase n=1 Tax=Eleusine coracana subsp. coracana TaxID=191504 RepID=A0AAV5D904_ELECO|nr:hypothetical protein PR202_ga24525 [Eleusine coracana subsp. coracana]